jgi:molybdate transport system substrate-binding protein
VRWIAGAFLVALLASSCGSGASGSPSRGGTLTVDAASSLTGAFTDLARVFAKQHPGWRVVTNFAGTDQLAAQVEQGQQADVFAGASPKYPEQLQQQHLLGPTRGFATNTLVVVVPASNPAGIASVHDLVSKRPTLVVGDPTVPIGAYTEQVLGNLGIDERRLNIVSKEVDVKSVRAKVTTGAADAGFVYVTDALAAGSQVRHIKLPAKAQATAIYPIGVLSDSSHKQAANWWIDLVTGPTGQAELRKLGFGAASSS